MDRLLHCGKCVFLRRVTSTSTISVRFKTVGPKLKRQTHYQVLNIQQKASSQEIRDAFVKLSKQVHPDHNPSDPENHEKFVRLHTAYSVLIKNTSRREYDAILSYNYNLYQNVANKHTYQSPTYSTNNYTNKSGSESQHGFDYQSVDWETFNKYREQDADSAYYGIKGLPRQSNTVIVWFCMFLILCGTISFYLAFQANMSLRTPMNFWPPFQSYTISTHKLLRQAYNSEHVLLPFASYSGRKRREYIARINRENTMTYNAVRENARKYTTAEQLDRMMKAHERGKTGTKASAESVD